MCGRSLSNLCGRAGCQFSALRHFAAAADGATARLDRCTFTDTLAGRPAAAVSGATDGTLADRPAAAADRPTARATPDANGAAAASTVADDGAAAAPTGPSAAREKPVPAAAVVATGGAHVWTSRSHFRGTRAGANLLAAGVQSAIYDSSDSASRTVAAGAGRVRPEREVFVGQAFRSFRQAGDEQLLALRDVRPPQQVEWHGFCLGSLGFCASLPSLLRFCAPAGVITDASMRRRAGGRAAGVFLFCFRFVHVSA